MQTVPEWDYKLSLWLSSGQFLLGKGLIIHTRFHANNFTQIGIKEPSICSAIIGMKIKQGKIPDIRGFLLCYLWRSVYMNPSYAWILYGSNSAREIT